MIILSFFTQNIKKKHLFSEIKLVDISCWFRRLWKHGWFR